MDRQQIERYRAGAKVPAQIIAGLSREELNARPISGTWSIQQIVLHLMDSDLIGSDRIKRVIAEDGPTLIGYDESRFAERLHYGELDPALACRVFEFNRQLTAEILCRLPDDVFSRIGQHNEHGPVSLANLVETYVRHLDHHLGFALEKRRLLGKEIRVKY